jgi:hypothetical protein|tara:strand:- start:2495 stop:2848 length:354 start_codon:yes stop_codon:yes gene_type:complete
MLTLEKKPTMKLKMIDCPSCDAKMPELRLTEYGYNFCVKCSEDGNKVKPKHAITVMMGEGDHTWVETIIMDDDQYTQYQNDEIARKNMDKTDKADMLKMDDNTSLQDTTIIKMENGK